MTPERLEEIKRHRIYGIQCVPELVAEVERLQRLSLGHLESLRVAWEHDIRLCITDREFVLYKAEIMGGDKP